MGDRLRAGIPSPCVKNVDSRGGYKGAGVARDVARGGDSGARAFPWISPIILSYNVEPRELRANDCRFVCFSFSFFSIIVQCLWLPIWRIKLYNNARYKMGR